VTNTKCRTDTVISPDDVHIVARKMWRKEINILRKIFAPTWLYLQDYAGMYGKQNIKFFNFYLALWGFHNTTHRICLIRTSHIGIL